LLIPQHLTITDPEEKGRLRRDDRQGYRAVSDLLSRDRGIPGSLHPGIWLRVSRGRKDKGRLRRDDLFYGDET